jgi:SAM-dependent methyltransferase
MGKKQTTQVDIWREYKTLLDLYCQHTDEYQRITIYVEQLIRRHNLPTNAVLDIGAGNGTLTFSVGCHFGYVVTIEPNPLFCSNLARKACIYGMQIELVCGFWPSVDLGQKRFDLILCAHVLYYIDISLWNGAIRLMLSHLNPGGILVVVLASYKSKLPRISTAVMRNVNTSSLKGDVWAEDLEETLRDHGFSFTVYELTGTVSTKSLEIAGKILAFLTSRGNVTTLNLDTGLIESYFQKKKGTYSLQIVDKVLTLYEDQHNMV